jgi:DNA-binding NtrC family response regulator
MLSPSSAAIAASCAPRIVLAEDDSALRDLLASALEHDGYEVVQAATGNELVDRVRHLVVNGETIHLIVSDVRMPKMSGLTVLKLLRDAELTMPVILITAFGDLWTRREAAQYGAVLLDKPVLLRTFRIEVEKALDRPRAHTART